MFSLKKESVIEIILDEIIKKVVLKNYLDSKIKIILCNSKLSIINNGLIKGINNYLILKNNSNFTNYKMYGRSPIMIDKCGSYLARYIAKNIVTTGLIDKLEIQLIYSKYSNQPYEICINSFGKKFDNGLINSKDIIEMIKNLFPLSKTDICEYFRLNACPLSKFVNYGLFVNNDAPWEKLNVVKEIKKYFTNKKGIIFLPNKIEG